MRFSILSVTAICAILGAASPVEKREPDMSDAGFSVSSTSTSGLSKRFSLISGGKVIINGVVVAPGTQLSPGLFIGGQGVPICYAYCLNAGIDAPSKAKCVSDGCPDVTINPNAFYVLKDDTTNYKGDRLHGCPPPAGGICADAANTPVDITPFPTGKTSN